jgi:tetratricopeptide (TPR) repeat protein
MPTTPSTPEDWLPHAPPAQPPERSGAARTLVTWLSLIVLLVAIYWFIGSEDPYAPEPERVGYSGWWIAVAVLITLVAILGLFKWKLADATKFNAAQAPALEALVEGKYREAAEMFAGLARRYRAKINVAAIASYNQGFALLRAGDTAAAIGIFLGVERMPKLGTGGIRKLAAIQLGRSFALAGDHAKAAAWLDAAREREPMADPVHDRAFVAALEGLVLCRQGKLEEANLHYDRWWEHLTRYLPVDQMIEVWLIRAYAVSAGASPRDAGTAERWLRLLRGAAPRSLDWLTARWPELQTLVVTHHLATPPATSAIRAST